MNPALRRQLRDLDRALLALLDERADCSRPFRATIPDAPRRRDSCVATHSRRTFAAVDEGCAESAGTRIEGER